MRPPILSCFCVCLPVTGAGAGRGQKMANRGSSECTEEFSDDGTLIGLYLLIAGIILVVFTLVGVFLQKHCGDSVSRAQAHDRETRFHPSCD